MKENPPMPEAFYKNLLLTQVYCDGVLKNSNQNTAILLRTINPLYKGQPIFTFSKCNFIINNKKHEYDSCEWLVKPFKDKYLINNLFDEQISFKKKVIINVELQPDIKGKIVIADFDDTVVDGASEVQSYGLFDVFDLPPIDTWFYLQTDTKGWRRMFAWIPDPVVALANDAINVNCVDCIRWH